MITLEKIPFLLHAIVETVAASSFILRPGSQLSNPPIESRLVLQLVGGLLLTTNLICGVFVARPVFDNTSRLVAGSLAFWHIWPMRRAWVRLSLKKDLERTRDATPPALGGPALHLLVHALLFSILVASALIGEVNS